MQPLQAPTLADIVDPLVDFLNRLESDDGVPYEIETTESDCTVAIPLFSGMSDTTARAIATLLQLGSLDSGSLPSRHPEKPLFVYLRRDCFGYSGKYFTQLNLYVDFEDELDIVAACHQIARLIAELEDPAKLVALSSKERARIF